jgi:hypothetical protein
MLVREQVLRPRLREDVLEKGPGHVAGKQTLSLFGEHRRVPDRVVHRQPDEPAEEQVVVQLFHQQPLAADRVQDLEQLRASSFSGGITGRPVRA